MTFVCNVLKNIPKRRPEETLECYPSVLIKMSFRLKRGCLSRLAIGHLEAFALIAKWAQRQQFVNKLSLPFRATDLASALSAQAVIGKGAMCPLDCKLQPTMGPSSLVAAKFRQTKRR